MNECKSTVEKDGNLEIPLSVFSLVSQADAKLKLDVKVSRNEL